MGVNILTRKTRLLKLEQRAKLIYPAQLFVIYQDSDERGKLIYGYKFRPVLR
jgi:hypothetical protein